MPCGYIIKGSSGINYRLVFHRIQVRGKDPDDLDGVIIDVDNKSFSLSNNIRYNFSRTDRRSWFRSISADIGLSYASQFTARRYWLNQGARPYGTATENSVYYAPIPHQVMKIRPMLMVNPLMFMLI